MAWIVTAAADKSSYMSLLLEACHQAEEAAALEDAREERVGAIVGTTGIPDKPVVLRLTLATAGKLLALGDNIPTTCAATVVISTHGTTPCRLQAMVAVCNGGQGWCGLQAMAWLTKTCWTASSPTSVPPAGSGSWAWMAASATTCGSDPRTTTQGKSLINTTWQHDFDALHVTPPPHAMHVLSAEQMEQLMEDFDATIYNDVEFRDYTASPGALDTPGAVCFMLRQPLAPDVKRMHVPTVVMWLPRQSLSAHLDLWYNPQTDLHRAEQAARTAAADGGGAGLAAAKLRGRSVWLSHSPVPTISFSVGVGSGKPRPGDCTSWLDLALRRHASAHPHR